MRDARVDLGCIDSQYRTVYQVIGVALEYCDDTVRCVISDIIRTQVKQRDVKRRKIEAVHPEQILVRQARERLNKLINDLEDIQRVEMMRFQENLENDRREFSDKLEEEKENFILKVQEEERMFFYNQDIQRSKFMSRMSRKKFQFERMQQESKAEFAAMEKQKLDKFKDKQSQERQTLLVNQKSSKIQERPNRWSTSSLEVAQLTGSFNVAELSPRLLKPDTKSKSLNNSIIDIAADSSSRRSDNSLGAETGELAGSYHALPALPSSCSYANYFISSRVKQRKSSCPPRLPCGPPTPCTPPPSPACIGALSRQNSSNASQNPSPVPSLEFIPTMIAPLSQTDLVSIPDTCPNIKALLALKILTPEPEIEVDTSEPDSATSNFNYLTYPLKCTVNQIPAHPVNVPATLTKSTPRITRKTTMEVLAEESDDNDDAATNVSNENDKSSLSNRKQSVANLLDTFKERKLNVPEDKEKRMNSISDQMSKTSTTSITSMMTARPSITSNESVYSCVSAKSQESVLSTNKSKDAKCRVI